MAGNSNSGNRPTKPISAAIRMALEREIKDKTTQKMTKQHHYIANQIVDLAVSGDRWAMEVCLERTEGKPHQSVDATVTYNPVEDLFGDIIAQSKARAVPGPADRKPANGTAH